MSQEDLEVLTEEVVEEEQPVSEDECIQVKKPVKKPIYKKKQPAEQKPKRERTQAQKDACERCLASRQKNREDRKKVQNEDAKLLAEYKKELAKRAEAKVVKKAVGIKKKAIMRDESLDEISEDETPIEVVKEKIKKTRQPRAKPVVREREEYQYEEPQQTIRTITFF